ncbi:MAG: YfbM family protein [Betaproteobacteria bacterium]|nr:YfbM family protein [Betaproteobacteria bacterium]
MSFIANYMMLDDDTLDSLLGLDNIALLEKIEELEETGTALYRMDEFWDGLHFLLTGTTASTPVEDDELSEAIVGMDVFNEDDEEADFIASTETDRLSDIIATMKDVDIEKLAENADLAAFREAEIYPDIWHDKDAAFLKQKLAQEFNNLLAFYEKAARKKAHILISIF